MINGLIKILSVSKPVQEMPAQQRQQPMFRARSPVSVLGGVIRLSAPYWHEQSMFILEQSVCLFIKGFDHSTPWPADPNYPPAEVIQFTPSPGQFGNILCFCVFFFFSELFLLLIFPLFRISLSHPVWISIPLLSHFLPNDGLIPRLKPTQSKQGLDSASLQ